MALFRKFFYRKPPDGLLEISENVYVFDCCFTTDALEEDEYKIYIGGIVGQLREHLPDASFMVFSFREGERQSQISNILSEFDMTVMDYPRHYEGCPLLTMEMIHHFLRSSESWLSLGQTNALLMHCERGGWPVLSFMLAALLIYRKQYSGEQKTLEMIYKQAPRELLQLMSPLNPLPSQLRYLQYVSRRNVASEWPPLDRALTLDCIIIRMIPNLDGMGGCRPIFRIYGQDPLMAADRTPKVLFSTPKRSKLVRYYKQAECELVKIDIRCHIQGDVVLECINLDDALKQEEMIFRVMFNTAFIRSNILMLNRDDIDTLWHVKDRFPKDFRTEVLCSEMNATAPLVSIELPNIEEKEGLPVEAFAKVQEMFSNVDWLSPKTDGLNMLHQITSSNVPGSREKMGDGSPSTAEQGTMSLESSPKPNLESAVREENISSPSFMPQMKQFKPSSKPSLAEDAVWKNIEPREVQAALQRSTQSKIISQRGPQVSLSTPVSYANSLQGSPVPVSRYHSAPSALGITALLHDHAPSNNKEVMSPVAVPLPTPPTSVSPVSNDPQPVQLSKLNIPSPPPAPPLKLPVVANSSEIDSSASMEKPSATHHQQLPPQPTTKGKNSTLEPQTTLPGRSQSSPIHLVTSSPSPLAESPSSFVKSFTPIPPPPPPPPSFTGLSPSSSIKNKFSTLPPPPPPPPPPLTSPDFLLTSSPSSVSNSFATPPPPPPPFFGASIVQTPSSTPPPTSPPPRAPSSDIHPVSSKLPTKPSATVLGTTPRHPPSLHSGSTLGAAAVTPSVPPPPPPGLGMNDSLNQNKGNAPPAPPPPTPPGNGSLKSTGASPLTNSGVPNANIPAIPGPPSAISFSAKGRVSSRMNPNNQIQNKKANLRPYHWLKLTRAMQGSLWADAQKTDEASKTPEFDMSELYSLFSAAAPNSEGNSSAKSNRRASGPKLEKVQLIELRRAYNCEIMLSKVKIPLPELMASVLALDDSALGVDQVENLIKFCPTKEEMDLLKGYSGDKEKLGKCELYFLEMMKVPRVESKLRVFSFKIQFSSQVSDLKSSLTIVNSASEEIRSSVKFKRVMQTILSLGNALNHGTARGSAIGFRLDSLLKLTDTRARNNKMTLMHYLCKVLAEKLPELVDFQKDLVSLEASAKIQLKYLAEEMQAISKGLEKVVQELTASENDGPISQSFCKTLKDFLSHAEAEVRSLASLYSIVGRNADALALYFGEDPARCPFEQVVSTLINFVRMFVRAHEENCKQLELEKKKAQKEIENEKLKISPTRKESEQLIQTPVKSSNIR